MDLYFLGWLMGGLYVAQTLWPGAAIVGHFPYKIHAVTKGDPLRVNPLQAEAGANPDIS